MVWKLVLLLLAVFGLYSLLGSLWRRRCAFEPGYEEVHLVRTRDGWRIALYRYPAASRRHPTPVLLCHGLGANRFNFDLGPDLSLARYLQREGFEVWSLDLRGRGRGGRPGGGRNRGRIHPVFDDYVQEDARAALRYVLDRTGASQVHWIGHSMGGLVLYAVLQGEGASWIASGVAVGSPGSFSHIGKRSPAKIAFGLLRRIPRLPLSFLASGLAPVIARIRLPGDSIFLNRSNVEVGAVERALCFLAADVSGGEISQFLDWVENGEFRSLDTRHSYEPPALPVRQPVLFLAGAKDRLAPPASVAAAYERIPSNRKAFRVLGREQGQAEDYGHGDLLIGKNVHREVFPLIRDWLASAETLGS
jgi:pimeloyl-ACP methyl ester carboxylesterase